MSKPKSLPRPDKVTLRRFALLMLLLAVTLLLSGAYAERKHVTLQIGTHRETVTTYAFTVGQFLASAGVSLGPLDQVEPGTGTELKDGETIQVHRAVCVTVIADGTVQRFFTVHNTVDGALAQAGITLGRLDQVQPSLSTPVTSGMQIRVRRVVSRQEIREVPVPFTTQVLHDARLAGGTARLLRPGRPGLARQVWQAVYTDGLFSSAALVSEVLLRAPQPALLAVSQAPEVSRGGTPDLYQRRLIMRATAYSPTGNRTATGTVPKVGTIAVDPRVIPLGTRLYVQGYGYGTALDTGGAIKGSRVDLFFNTGREAKDWGVRYVRVYVLS